MSTKPEFKPNLVQMLALVLITAPDSQLSLGLKNESNCFFSSPRTPREAYDFFNNISSQSVSEASQFVKSLCDVGRFYQRPNE